MSGWFKQDHDKRTAKRPASEGPSSQLEEAGTVPLMYISYKPEIFEEPNISMLDMKIFQTFP